MLCPLHDFFSKFLFKIVTFKFMFYYLCVHGTCLWRTEDDNVFPGVEGIDNSEPLHVGAEN